MKTVIELKRLQYWLGTLCQGAYFDLERPNDTEVIVAYTQDAQDGTRNVIEQRLVNYVGFPSTTWPQPQDASQPQSYLYKPRLMPMPDTPTLYQFRRITWANGQAASDVTALVVVIPANIDLVEKAEIQPGERGFRLQERDRIMALGVSKEIAAALMEETSPQLAYQAVVLGQTVLIRASQDPARTMALIKSISQQRGRSKKLRALSNVGYTATFNTIEELDKLIQGAITFLSLTFRNS